MGRGKRNQSIVISSTDDEDDTGVTPKSRSKPASVSRVRNPKKGSLSNSRYRSCRESDFNDFDAIKQFCDEFDEGIRGFKVHTVRILGRGMSIDLWVDRYKPHYLEELAVYKRKVDEATVHAIASHFGATVCEWNTPTPTIWQEHLHNCSSGLRYTSKLDEFETFVERIRKYGFIFSCVSGSLGSYL